MSRTHFGKIRFTEEEWKRLQNKSKLALGQVNVSQYIRLKSLSSDITAEEMITAIYKKLIQEKKEVEA